MNIFELKKKACYGRMKWHLKREKVTIFCCLDLNVIQNAQILLCALQT